MGPMLHVHVRVTDAATGGPTPVRIRIAGPDGTYYPPLGYPRDFPVGRGEFLGGQVYLAGRKFAHFDGSAEFPLPAGVPLSVEISKGPAYLPVRQTVTLREGQLTLRFAIARWTDDRWSGLIAADGRCHFLSPHAARLEAAAEGLDLVNVLAAVQDYPSPDGHGYRLVPDLAAFSGQAPALGGVSVNTFNVHPVLGRLGLLNSHRPVFPLTFGHADETDDWSLADWCDQCHRKGGLVVWCDAYRPEAGLPGGEALVNAVLGRVDAIELDAQERTAAFLPAWYRLLNAGVRLPLVGSSAKDSNRTALGAFRTLTPAGSDTSYRNWVETIRAGRTVASNGPFLRLFADDEPFPGRVVLAETRPVRLRAEAASAFPFDRLELIADGVSITTATATGSALYTATVEAEHLAPAGGWAAARCLGGTKPDLYPHGPTFAHTSPTWIEIAGRPMPGRSDARAALVREIDRVRDWVATEGRFTHPRRKEHLLGLCDAARNRLDGST